MILKAKMHILLHLPEDVRRFGPPITLSTEIFESYNGVFRLCSMLSNRQAPSRDIARKFASMGRVQHILSGGWWKVGDKWTRASKNVLATIKRNPPLQRNLGWATSGSQAPGSATPTSKRHRGTAVQWAETGAEQASAVLGPPSIEGHEDLQYIPCKSIVGRLGDKIRAGNFVIVQQVSNPLSIFPTVYELTIAFDNKSERAGAYHWED